MPAAYRSAGIKISIDGEKELTAQIKRINAEFNAMQQGLKLVQAEYAGQRNGMRALTAEGEALRGMLTKLQEKETLYAEKGRRMTAHLAEAEEKLNASAKNVQELEEAYADLANSGTASNKELEKQNAELRKGEKQHAQNVQTVERYRAAIARNEADQRKNQLAMAQCNAELVKNKKYLDDAGKSASKTTRYIDEFGNEVSEAARELQFQNALVSMEKIRDKAEAIRKIIADCAAEAQRFDLSVKNIEKTVDGIGAEEIRGLVLGLSGDMPIDPYTLAQIAAGGGQYRVSTAGLENYTKTIAMLTTATDIDAGQGAQNLARFANLTQMNEADYSRLGSSITALGNTTATTESQIIDMAQGIASMAHIVGMSESEILAYAASLSAVGVESAAGGTALSALMQNIDKFAEEGGEKLEKIAALAGMNAEEFKKSWKEDAAGALNSFVDGLSEAQRQGHNIGGMMKELGINEKRMQRAVLGLATSEGVLTSSMETAKGAWKENIALEQEYLKFADADINKKQLMTNATTALKIAVGDALTPALNTFYEILGKGAEGLTELIEKCPVLIQLLAALSVGITSFVGFVGLANGAKLLGAGIKALNDGVQLFGLTLNTTGAIIAAATIAVAALVAIIASYESAQDKLNKKINEYNEAEEDKNRQAKADSEAAKIQLETLKKLEAKYGEAAGQMTEYKVALDKLRDSLPGVNLEIDEQTGLLKSNTDEIHKNIDALLEYRREQAKQEKITATLDYGLEVAEQYEEALANVAKKEAELEKIQKGGFLDPRGAKTALELAKMEAADLFELMLGVQDKLGEMGYDVSFYKPDTGSASPASQMAELYRVVGEYTGSTSPLSQSAEEWSEYRKTVQGVFETIYEEMKKSLEGTFSALEDFDEKSGIKLNDFSKNLKKNAESIAEYTNNLNAVLADDRISESMKQYIKNLAPEQAYGLLDELVSASDEKLAEVNGNFEAYSSALETAAGDLTVVSDEFADQMYKAMLDANQYPTAVSSGMWSVQGLIDGMNTKEKALKAKADEIAGIFNKVYVTRNKINSPSRLLREAGQYTMEGLILGYRDKEDELRRESEKAAAAGLMGYNSALSKMSASTQIFASYTGRDYTDILNRMYGRLGNIKSAAAPAQARRVSPTAKAEYEREMMTRLLY